LRIEGRREEGEFQRETGERSSREDWRIEGRERRTTSTIGDEITILRVGEHTAREIPAFEGSCLLCFFARRSSAEDVSRLIPILLAARSQNGRNAIGYFI
jgi:hypothetical protein